MIIDALTTGTLQEFGTLQRRTVSAALAETPGRRPGTAGRRHNSW
jgi:hypothetical protein